MLVMTALELCDPIILLIEVETNNASFRHLWRLTFDMRGQARLAGTGPLDGRVGRRCIRACRAQPHEQL
jgi:hypothetical protein